MHVAMLFDGPISREYGTSERVLQIAEGLAHQVNQVTLSGRMEHRVKQSNLINLRVLVMPNRILRFFGICGWIAQLVAGGLSRKYDIVQMESFSFSKTLALFLLLRPFSGKFVIVFSDKWFEHDPRKTIIGRLQVTVQRILLTLFNASITPGLSVKKWFEELHGVLANKIVVIPNGAPDFAITKNIDYSHLREKYKIHSNTFVALFFGSMTFKPNYDTAMYLYNISDSTSQKFEKSTGRKLIFIVAGISSETLPKTENFIPLGFVNELEELLSLPDVIVFPHLPSFSGPHVKTAYAFLSKKPVIASEDAVKDMPYVTPGKQFLPFDINEPDTLLESLTELHCNKELGKRLAINAYLYSKKFSWEHVSSVHLKLYEKLIS
jgi:glycosyltransferase involved in cell wall biosynthesis